MSYSCTAKANCVLKKMVEQLQASSPCEQESQNTWQTTRARYFYEQGRENNDGAITGSVMMFLGTTGCRRVGSYRIEPNGTISRFPTSTKAQRQSGMAVGLVKYLDVYGGGWKEDGVLSQILGDCSFVVI